MVPKSWFSQYLASRSLNVGSWVSNLADRCNAVCIYSNIILKFDSVSAAALTQFWLGGMFNPEAFITASRQATAQANHWSLEDLELSVHVGETTCEGVQDTIVSGLMLEGASWARDSLMLSSDLRCNLPPTRLRWGLKAVKDVTANNVEDDRILFPMYLNELRSAVVAEVYVNPPKEFPREVWAQRGVGIIMQSVV